MELNQNPDEIFNQKIRQILSDLAAKSQLNSKYEQLNFKDTANNCDIFVFLKRPIQPLVKEFQAISLNNDSESSEIITISELRILLLVNFVARLVNIK